MMFPTTIQNFMMNDINKNTMNLFADVINQNLLQQSMMSHHSQQQQHLQEPLPQPHHSQQQHIQIVNPNININHATLPPRISVDGRLYALLPITNQNSGDTIDYMEEAQFRFSEPRNVDLQLPQQQQQRDDSNSNRGTSRLDKTNKSTQRRPHKAGKDARGSKHRPSIRVAPKSSGPISSPSINDVLLGRGGRINKHQGNIQLRNIVASRQQEYLASTTQKLDKAYIAADIVSTIRLSNNPPGRFLEKNALDHSWYEVGDERAIRKVLQALREHAPEIRSNNPTSFL
jgi:hypothetical protein